MLRKKTGKLIKEMSVRSFKEIKGILFINEMIIKDHQHNHTTLYKLLSTEVNPTLDESIFTVRHLER
ncbi:MAG: outer membrane lipoprotein-sorting protein [Spirochaetes bacterium]|nr:outer membrane lipoprotein-sorting protein [Spirochaetota bacterium]